MIGVDTNVLLRLFVDDDAAQHEAARVFFSGRSPRDPAFVSLVVLAELIWVVTKHFGYSHARALDLIDVMISSADFALERLDLVREAVQLCRSGSARIVDVLVTNLAMAQGCTAIVTFDTRAAKRIPGMDLLK